MRILLNSYVSHCNSRADFIGYCLRQIIILFGQTAVFHFYFPKVPPGAELAITLSVFGIIESSLVIYDVVTSLKIENHTLKRRLERAE